MEFNCRRYCPGHWCHVLSSPVPNISGFSIGDGGASWGVPRKASEGPFPPVATRTDATPSRSSPTSVPLLPAPPQAAGRTRQVKRGRGHLRSRDTHESLYFLSAVLSQIK